MYICMDCGHVFESAGIVMEPHFELDGCPVEILDAGCPRCGGDYDEARQCKGCGEWFCVEDLREDMCEDCLLDAAEPEKFLEFATSNSEYEHSVDVLEDFIFFEFFHLPLNAVPNVGSRELREHMLKLYREAEEAGTLNAAIDNFLKYNHDVLDDFACWIAK